MLSTAKFAVVALLVCAIAAVTIDELGFTEENCAAIRASATGAVPCECRLNTGNVKAYACFPNCCPKTDTFEGDRCHVENRLLWSVFEQQVCFEAPPKESTDDTPNCFYRGNVPRIMGVSTADSKTKIEFELSIIESHRCNDLYIAQCKTARENIMDYRLNTTTSPYTYCWLDCGPKDISACTESSCWAHRGETPAVIRDWTLDRALAPGDYALVCYTMVRGEAVGSTLYQTAYAAEYFQVV